MATTPKKTTTSKSTSYNDSKKPPKSTAKAVNKILSESKKKAKLETEKRKAPKTNWITKL